MLSYLISTIAQLKWALDIILHRTFFWSSAVPDFVEEVISEERELDCAICLCNIGEGEEIRELRCKHVFHGGCLDRWLAFKSSTCPLCRDFLAPLRTFTEFGAEILTFKFCSFSDSDSDNWWLR